MGNHRADSRPARRTPAPAEPVDPGPSLAAPSLAGKRRASRHTGSRGPLFRGLPSAPVLLGVATLAVAIGGAVSSSVASSSPDAELAGATVSTVRPATALTGQSGTGRVDTTRDLDGLAASRSGATRLDTDSLVDAAQAQASERDAVLGELATQAEAQAKVLEENRWYLPLRPSIITGTYGAYGLWSSGHSGLDFNGETGDPIYSIANGTVIFTGYSGNCGNMTKVVLDDGTMLMYCHQNTILVAEGDRVVGNEIIGTVGTTGRVTGSHLHVQVHPTGDGGPTVDPYQAFVEHGVTP